MSGVITQICQNIDMYNGIDQLNKKSIRLRIHQYITRRKLLQIINRIKTYPLDSFTMNDFFRNYISTLDFIHLDGCECAEEKDQFLFTIKTDKVTVVYSTRKLNNQTISVSAKWSDNIYTWSATYHDRFVVKDKDDIIAAQKTTVAKKYESLLCGYISTYLLTRLNLYQGG